MLLVPGDISQLIWPMSCFSPFKMQFFLNVLNLHFNPIWKKILKDIFLPIALSLLWLALLIVANDP